VYRHTIPYAYLHARFGAKSPTEIVIVMALRKFYSLVAFALAGFVADRALPAHRRPALRSAVIVGAFSFCIEVAQYLTGSTESIYIHVMDVTLGVIGGWIGGTVSRRTRRAREGA